MPVKYDDQDLGVGWQQNATYLFGILLHPLGEIEPIDFLQNHLNGKDLVQSLVGLQRQVVFDVIIACLFATSFNTSIQMVIKRPRLLKGWLCLIPSLFGVSRALCVMAAMLFSIVPCRVSVWYLAFCLTISSISNSAIILQRHTWCYFFNAGFWFLAMHLHCLKHLFSLSRGVFVQLYTTSIEDVPFTIHNIFHGFGWPQKLPVK
ncbi:hypothetical protein BDF19DRAFT_285085 [Syncephalis fuscata]|nr:hypothetical protein BDF19DRAFT_285085 [Syncephalis fuscata]